jgi:hypothetical protein
MSLESLEDRTVLSNVTILPIFPGTLTITGDSHNDSFTIMETPGGIVAVAPGAAKVVPGLGLVPGSTIDGTRFPYVSDFKVTSIVVDLPGTVNFDTIALDGPGKTTATPIQNVTITATGPNLTFLANGVDNSGSLTVSATVGLPRGNDAALHAQVDNSTFLGGIAISQTGNGPATVELGNDATNLGPVSVSEGVGNADTITLDQLAGGGDTFAATTLAQGAGPAYAGSNGNGDSVSVSKANVADLDISQAVGGNGTTISVNTLSVALGDFGLETSQGDGNGDTTTISGFRAPIPTTVIGPPPPASILVTQGNGNGDSTTVENSTLPGNITMTQGNGNGDTALVTGVDVGFTVKSGSKTKGYYGNITITQGTGLGDTAKVTNSTVVGTITITHR